MRTRAADRPPVLGLRENAAQFALLVAVNALVGGMVGQQQTVLPLLAEDEFGLAAVRLAAVEALYLAAPEGDRDGRVEAALRGQDRPEVQAALVDLLVALRQRRAAEALRSLLAEGRLAPSARRQAERRLADL